MASVKFARKNGEVYDSMECMKNLNILGHAQLIELDIGSVCGGHGHCGKDKVKPDVKTASLISPLSPAEMDHLTEEEIGRGVRLACQCFPEQDGLNLMFLVLKT